MGSFWHTACIMLIGAQKLPFLVCKETEFGHQIYLGRSTSEVNEEGRKQCYLFIYSCSIYAHKEQTEHDNDLNEYLSRNAGESLKKQTC